MGKVGAPTYGEGWGPPSTGKGGVRGRVGIAGLKCGAITFRVSPQCRGNDGVLTLGSLPQAIYYC